MMGSVLKKLFSFFMLSCCLVPLFGQVRDLSGQVKDNDGTPVEGVTVTGSGSSTTTSADGMFLLRAQQVGAQVVFSAIGYRRHVVNVPATGRLDIALTKEQTDLDEVVVIGYGEQRSEERRVGKACRGRG